MTCRDETRRRLVRAMGADLVGPEIDEEVLEYAPSRWYLAGLLVPFEAGEDQRHDPEAEEEIQTELELTGGDDDNRDDAPSRRKAFFPSSMGLSLIVPGTARSLKVTVYWGDYALVHPPADDEEEEGSADDSREEHEEAGEDDGNAEEDEESKHPALWKRKPRSETLALELPREGKKTRAAVPDSEGLELVVTARRVPEAVAAEAGAETRDSRSVSIFLVNKREPKEEPFKDEAFIFQAELIVESETPFVSRGNLRGYRSDDRDERIADLQYRDVAEFAVGHGVSTHAEAEDGACRRVRTTWIPTAEVEKVEPAKMENVELGMNALGNVESGNALGNLLADLPRRYRAWIDEQEVPEDEQRAEVAKELLGNAKFAAKRIERGIELLETDPEALEAFRIANRAMAAAARKRFEQEGRDVKEPAWRPFQLAFILMNLEGIVEPTSNDRQIVDLLFFPTGGGKTEAYLGLAAFTLVLRRLRNEGISAAGVTVLMRYTLRLLTLDQLGRASALICALELEREKDDRLGEWPFEIGLWVGSGATPNRMGAKGRDNEYTARSKTRAYKRDSKRYPAPIPLENCPWCGTRFTPHSFKLEPNEDHPTDLRVRCVNRRCEFRGAKRSLPVLSIDEPIYRRLPCFLIATVDKFANLPWVGRSGALFGKVDRYDADGFYGPAEPGKGSPLPVEHLIPPELIIQDELHLISGPLGTMVGLYETAIDAFSRRTIDEQEVRPKIVASTATIRRAEAQVKALFARNQPVEIFPPPGPNRRDSFFAETKPSSERNARLYVGVAAQGRSLKRILLRTYLALLGAAQKEWEANGGAENPDNPADPYMTLVGYFNSLRELGGSRRIVEDEVRSRLQGYGERKRWGEKEGLFADRSISSEPVELTSREPTNKVSDTKRRLALPFRDEERIDVALATNMISVGLDITRLGLMVVLGQPKTSSEYIQATSRVGRDDKRPGLVVTLFNMHRPRDRSHYERFEAYHASFYRAVEATSVTPFAPRAVDRGLPAVAVALARHEVAKLTPPRGAGEMPGERQEVADHVARLLCDRATAVVGDGDPEEREKLCATLSRTVSDLFDDWSKFADECQRDGVPLQYQKEVDGSTKLLHQPLDPEPEDSRLKKFSAGRSLRDVEPSVSLIMKRLDGGEVPEPEDHG